MTQQLQGIEGLSDTMKAFVQMTRDFIRDHPELNRLTAGQETGNRLIAWCVLDALSRFNGTPHLTNYTLDDLLGRNQHHLLLRMTVTALLESVGQFQTRNHINYSSGGINVGVNDKTPLIMQWLQYFRASTDQLMQRVKVAMNIEGILGPGNTGVHSELWAVNASYLMYH
jgi:hypothetical protein